MKDILIIVSTWNRRDLTGITLDSLARSKSKASDILILDDCSTDYTLEWLQSWEWNVERSERNAGVGETALLKYVTFLKSPKQYRYLCTVDNDLLFGACFDYRLRQLWDSIKVPEQPMILTGYRSTIQTVLKDHEDWLEVDSVGGAAQFVDRETAELLVQSVPAPRWGHNWDHIVSSFFERKVSPKRSLVQHLGVHGTGMNGILKDVALDFVGDNMW